MNTPKEQPTIHYCNLLEIFHTNCTNDADCDVKGDWVGAKNNLSSYAAAVINARPQSSYQNDFLREKINH